jgi:hypothetical protein
VVPGGGTVAEDDVWEGPREGRGGEASVGGGAVVAGEREGGVAKWIATNLHRGGRRRK